MAKRFNTIKDIAKALDISVATVSRALRDTYDVSRETREKVLNMATQLHYRPNLNALGLVQRHTHNIGIIIPTITNYYFSTVITGIQEVANASGYNIILFITNDHLETEQKLIRELSLTSLDGILACVSPQAGSSSHFQDLIDEEVPLVFFDRAADIRSAKVVQDDYNGAVMAVEHLIECGYKKIAHIAGSGDLLLSQNRLNGYIDTLKRHHLWDAYARIIHSGFSQLNGEQDTQLLFSGDGECPDAIFAVNDRKAIGAIVALKRMDISVGKDVGVIGFTNDPMSEIISPTLSTIAEPAYEIGKISCEILLASIKKGITDSKEVVLSGELIIRESTSKGKLL